MSNRNDPDVLEREAEALVEEFEAGRKRTEEEARASEAQAHDTDTLAAAESEDQTPPEGAPSDTAESAEGADDEPAESGEQDDSSEETETVSELREKLRISEERYKNAQSRMTKATQEASELRRENASLSAEKTALQKSLEQADVKPNGSANEDADLDKLLEDYPDVVGPLVSRLRSLESKVGEQSETQTRSEKQRAVDAHFESIESAHKDWEEVVSSEDWEGWVSRQGRLRQRAAEEGTAEEVIELIDAYKQDMGIAKPGVQEDSTSTPEPNPPQSESSNVERARRLAEPSPPRARTPDPNAGKRIFTAEEIRKMPLSEYEKLADEIDQATREGRVRG